MATVLLVCVVILVIAALVFGIVSLLTGEDPGLAPVEPDGRALPLPNHRSLTEADLKSVRFDVALRGYRMAQVDRALRRTAYDVGYKDEMIAVLEAEVAALREGRLEDADLLRKAREAAANPEPADVVTAGAADDDEPGAEDAPEATATTGATEAGATETDASEADASEARVDAEADAGEPVADAESDEQPAATAAEPQAEVESEGEADEASSKDAAEPAAAPAPAARSAPTKSSKRTARA